MLITSLSKNSNWIKKKYTGENLTLASRTKQPSHKKVNNQMFCLLKTTKDRLVIVWPCRWPISLQWKETLFPTRLGQCHDLDVRLTEQSWWPCRERAYNSDLTHTMPEAPNPGGTLWQSKRPPWVYHAMIYNIELQPSSCTYHLSKMLGMFLLGQLIVTNFLETEVER